MKNLLTQLEKLLQTKIGRIMLKLYLVWSVLADLTLLGGISWLIFW